MVGRNPRKDLDNVPFGFAHVCVVNRRLMFAFVNKWLVELTGWSNAQWLNSDPIQEAVWRCLKDERSPETWLEVVLGTERCVVHISANGGTRSAEIRCFDVSLIVNQEKKLASVSLIEHLGG